MIRVGLTARRSSTVIGGRRRGAAEVNGAISDTSPGRPLMRIVRRPSETTSLGSGASMISAAIDSSSVGASVSAVG